ncbi:hypothetical protein C7N43_00140 [Sphingobacteriales bacterium UPWRP_1]|nr:hypothetical protein BVG80_15070 [Sphingobacteriales bacterium TSM_CSM]PSJ79070.1 hypothetical protein C7N43_00140 [Sphingobacteriales bacterium UPWRP_1]
MQPPFTLQVRTTLAACKKTVSFIQHNRLWQNFGQIKWIARIVTAAGILLALQFIKAFEFWKFTPFNPNALANAGANLSHIGSNLYQQVADMYSGSYKYIVLICMQALIGHFGGKTSYILSKIPYEPTFKNYLHDQWRIIKVSGLSWVSEIFYGAIAGALLGIVQLTLLEQPVNLLIQCYLLGFTIADVYCAHNGMSIMQSYRFVKGYAPVLVIVGAVYYLLLLIPVVGAPAGAIFCTVALLLTMNRLVAPNPELPTAPITPNNLPHEQ